MLAHDDNHPIAALTFPSLTYESFVRFELPRGKHQPLDVRFMAQSAGVLELTIYDNSVFEAPGTLLRTETVKLSAGELSDGHDGRWVVDDLRAMPPMEGVLWIGLRMTDGSPAIWTAAGPGGQTFLRDRDPTHGVGLLPVKRSLMLRLDVDTDLPGAHDK